MIFKNGMVMEIMEDHLIDCYGNGGLLILIHCHPICH